MTDKMTRERVAEIVYEVIHERADQMIRERMAAIVAEVTHEQVAEIVAAARAKTLADMTLDEQDECTGMQADLAQGDRVVILDGTPDHAGLVQVLEKSLDVYRAYPAEVAPRPDLPRMEWPAGDEEAEDANTVKVGTVIESADDPRIAALPAGSILLDREGEAATKRRWEWMGRGYIPIPSQGGTFGPWTVLHIPKEADQ